jgi:hypothetical protein
MPGSDTRYDVAIVPGCSIATDLCYMLRLERRTRRLIEAGETKSREALASVN